MNIRQLQYEISAIELLRKYAPIIDAIMTMTENVGIMSDYDRKRWIEFHALRLSGSEISYVVVEEIVTGQVTLSPTQMGLSDDSMGVELLKKFTPNDIVCACTYWCIENRSRFADIIIYGNPPLLSNRRKVEDRSSLGVASKEMFSFDASGYNCFVLGQDGARVQVISQEAFLTEKNINNAEAKDIVISDTPQALVYPIDEIEKIAKEPKSDFIVKVDLDFFRKIKTSFIAKWAGVQLDKTGSDMEDSLMSRIPSDAVSLYPDWSSDKNMVKVANPIFFELDGETIAVPSSIKAWLLRYQIKEFRLIRRDSGWVADASTRDTMQVEVPRVYDDPSQGLVTIDVPSLRQLNVFVWDEYDTYPAVGVRYNPENPMAQPATLEEIQTSQVEVLKLPAKVLMAQSREVYNGRKLPISAISLDKWKNSNHTYEDAVSIMEEHLAYFTIVDEAGNRTNNGQIYDQTKEGVAKRLTDSKGKVDQLAFMEIMSKYSYTIEETFFNLNPDFSNPEKLLGYFLGMGIQANNLYLNEVSPYRILCARLLGIDYAINYLSLCKSSVIAGYLFVSEFNDGKPVFCNAETFLDGNFYTIKYTLETAKFQKEMAEFFGEEKATQVIDQHMDLVRENSPKFMKLRHGTAEEFQSLVRENGTDKPYNEDREQEITRITMTQGLWPTNNSLYLKDVWQGSLKLNKYLDATASRRMADEKFESSWEGVPSAQRAFSKYTREFNTSLSGRASDKLRYNNITKENSIENFFFEPRGRNFGVLYLLGKGITISNKEFGENSDERQTRVVRFPFSEVMKPNGKDFKYDEDKQPPKAGVDYLMEFMEYGTAQSTDLEVKNRLRELGYDPYDKVALKKLMTIVYQRARGLYHEIASQAKIEGDNLLSLATAIAVGEDAKQASEDIFNHKYNNFAMKPMSRVPIFMENRRHFGDIGNFVADRLNQDGSAAGFNLREAQKDGLKFLAANGNSGLLAHEVGFGKTTSSIAKISDMFLRGDAKRVLISVPNPVYTTGNWEREISGKNTDGRRVSNGLLPSNVTLVKIGALNRADLQGRKIDKSDPNWEEKSEGTGFDGPIAYSEADVKLMDNLKGTTDSLKAIVGGANQKYGGPNSMLTPREQKFGYDERDVMWLQANPFFKKAQEIDKSQIVRLNDLPPQELGSYVTTIKSGDFDFWDVGSSPYMAFGEISDMTDSSVSSSDSFMKRMAEDLVSLSPDLIIDSDGGDLEVIAQKLKGIHDKYKSKYDYLKNYANQFANRLEKKGNNYKQELLGGAFKANSGSITKEIKKWRSEGKEGGDQVIGALESRYNGNELTYFIALKLYQVIRGETKTGFWPWLGTRSFYERVVVPWAEKNHKNSSLDDLHAAIVREFPWTNIEGDQYDAPVTAFNLALGQLKTALELQMTEEFAFFFETLNKQAPLFLGKFKEWAKRPNTIVLCSHLAIPKLSVSEKLGKMSVEFMSGLYGDKDPMQRVNARIQNEYVKKERIIKDFGSTGVEMQHGVLTRGQRTKLFLSQYRGMDMNRLACDAFIVDEVHNFNRAFNVVKKGSKVTAEILGRKGKYGRKTEETNKEGGKINAHMKGVLRYPELVFEYDTKANYNIRGEVQNFIAVCLYFQERAEAISKNQKRKIDNTIFLSATPFTDDNFQMLSLFGALSMRRLMQGNVFNTYDFFQVYAKELWQKDIDYQNRYTLFPKIVGYKNIYSLSQMIRTFTNFKISDAEIEAKRPSKIIVGVKPPQINESDAALDKLVSQVPFNDVQKKMNEDLTKYITLESDSELQYTDADLKKAEDIAKKLEKKGGKKGNPADPLVKELRNIAFDKQKVSVDATQEEEAVRLSDEILEIDAENKWAKLFLAWYDNALEEGAESEEGGSATEDEAEDSDDSTIDANAVSNESSTASLAQKIAQRALEASRTQQLTLISPYYLTINNNKELMNPYLPPLDGTESENAKNVVENSPKLLYACKAVAKVIAHALNEKGQKYMGADESEPLMGQVIYANNYKFRYHGKDFFLFDLMKQYIIDQNKEMLLPLVGDDETRLGDLFASIDGRTKKFKDPVSGEMVDEKAYLTQKFQTGEIIILFGTEIIREGINLQKNCPLMYILQVGFVPVTYMQLHGRVWRQGNPYKYAFLVNVLTQNSIDAFVYSKLDQKIESVKQMLGSDVYDSEATQFDVDVKEIKTELINDPAKLAEMQWEDDQQDLSRLTDKLKEELSLLPSLARDYPQAVDAYEKAIKQFNKFSKIFYFLESLVIGSQYQNFKNNALRREAALQQANKDFPAQFPNDKVRDEFVKKPDDKKWFDKQGQAKYETKQEMISRLRSSVKIAEISLEDAMKAVQDASKADETLDGNVGFRMVLKAPFEMTTLTSTSAFSKNVDIVFDVAERARREFDTIERNQNLEKAKEELTKLGADVALALGAGGPEFEFTGEMKDVLSAFSTSKNQGSYKSRGRHVATIAALLESNPDWMEDGFIRAGIIQNAGKRFRTGDEAITIGAFNDIVSNEQMPNGKDATLEDVPELIAQKEQTLSEAQSKLDNEEQTKQELEKYFANKIAQRDGQKVPSVEERVNDLEAIFPYLIRR